VPFAVLLAIAELPEGDLRRGLAHLQAAELLYETSLLPDLEYTFKHALTHEVTYGGLLQERRRELHARIVSAIENLHRDRLAEQIGPLAHHALHGEEWDRAVRYLRQAGLRSMARAAYREAADHLEHALEACRHLPESRGTAQLALELRFELRTSLAPVRESERMLGVLREAEALAC